MSASITACSRLTRRLLAPNPGPMTLDGTNSYLIGVPDAAGLVVVDPGPLDGGHLGALARAGRVELVLLTHRHADHTAGAARLAELTGAPVRAIDPALCIGAPPLRDGERVTAAGVDIDVIATPGHTDDSLCLHLPGDGPLGSGGGTGAAAPARAGSVLTGDTVLGRGSTVIGHPGGTLADYLRSLDRLAALGPALVLPGHGPLLPSLAAVCAEYREHRLRRLAEVRAAVAALNLDDAGPRPGLDALVPRITAIVYPAVDERIRVAAEASVRAQLEHLLR